MTKGTKSKRLAFRPRARLISILGEQLISDQAVGVTELVKNSYDADATHVTVELNLTRDSQEASVSITDNGTGMSIEEVESGWLSPAYDHKDRAKNDGMKTKLGRWPIGEKGVGRFAVHQIGERLELVTKARNLDEVSFSIDWNKFDDGDTLLSDISIPVHVNEARVFGKNQSGTKIVISGLKGSWNKHLVSKISRSLRRLQSPFAIDKSQFKVILSCSQHMDLEDVDPSSLLKKAHYEFTCEVDEDGRCNFEYHCKHPAIESRSRVGSDVDLLPIVEGQLQRQCPSCGPFSVSLYAWDRFGNNLQASGVLRQELDAFCGVSLYRDNIRILPYGEPENDWLLLDRRRVQQLSGYIGNNQVIGFVQFEQSNNKELRDKTNREGLIENSAFLDLRALAGAVVRQLFGNKCWLVDSKKVRRRKSSKRERNSIATAKDVATAVRDQSSTELTMKIPGDQHASSGAKKDRDPSELTESDIGMESATRVVTHRRATEILLNHIVGAEQEFGEQQRELDMLLQLVATGLAAERVVHEFGRHMVNFDTLLGEVSEQCTSDQDLANSVRRLQDIFAILRSEFRNLAPYGMLRQEPRARQVNLKHAAQFVYDLNKETIANKRVAATIDGKEWSMRIRNVPLVQILDNLVNNACDWLSSGSSSGEPRVGIVFVPEKSLLLVADNGPGIDVDLSPNIFEPKFSMRESRKGMGLYVSRELAKNIGAKLELVGSEKSELRPNWATGSVFALEFQDKNAKSKK